MLLWNPALWFKSKCQHLQFYGKLIFLLHIHETLWSGKWIINSLSWLLNTPWIMSPAVWLAADLVTWQLVHHCQPQLANYGISVTESHMDRIWLEPYRTGNNMYGLWTQHLNEWSELNHKIMKHSFTLNNMSINGLVIIIWKDVISNIWWGFQYSITAKWQIYICQ